MTKQFETGKTYSVRSIGDSECIFSFEVVKRTEKTVWLKSSDGNIKGRRVRIDKYSNCEAVDPYGVYSMSPVLHATDTAEALTEREAEKAAAIVSRYGPKVEWDQLTAGTRVYYTGDMANCDGFGVITKSWHDEKWGYRQVNITMDDGREMRGIHLASFQPAPGRRFWLEVDYHADRQQRIKAMKAEYAKRTQQPAAPDETITDSTEVAEPIREIATALFDDLPAQHKPDSAREYLEPTLFGSQKTYH